MRWIEVEKGWNRFLLLKVRFTTTAHRMHVCGALRSTLERGRRLLLVLGEIRKEEGRSMCMVHFVITVSTGAMKHLAGCSCTCDAARSKIGAGNAGTRREGGGPVASESLAKETLGSGRRAGLVV
jgi:hypothetical protein